MTWLKLPDEFDDQCEDLSDSAYRLHVNALVWVMRRELGPRFPKRKLRLFAQTTDPDTDVTELVSRGFWLDLISDYEVVYGMEHQPEPEVLAKRRADAAERQRRYRRKQVGLPDLPEDDDVTP
jgi:hypothetical protein